jgi:hypothetical protein
MITSYLDIVFPSQSVPQENATYLPDLIHFGSPAFGLQIEDLLDPVVREDVMAATDPLLEAQAEQETPHLLKADVGVGRTAQDTLE